MAATNSNTFPTTVRSERHFSRDLTELLVCFAMIMLVLWLPTREQLILGPIALLTPLVLTFRRDDSRHELGLSWRGFVRSLWILPASAMLTLFGVLVARRFGIYHELYDADFGHVAGYVLWTIYQQFLLQDFFMPRLTSVLKQESAFVIGGVLFAAAHLPNPTLMVATLAWGIASCWLFRRYRSIWVLGLAQGLLGLAFAVCVPNAMHHHMRVGLGYIRYHGSHTTAAASVQGVPAK